MNSLNQSKCILAVFVLVSGLSMIQKTSASCFSGYGCSLNENNQTRKEGDRWVENCNSCQCYSFEVTVATCVEPYLPVLFPNVKKSSDVVEANLENSELVKFPEVKRVLLPEDSVNFTCPDFDFESVELFGELVQPEIHFIDYVIKTQMSSCCSLTPRAINVHSDCDVIKMGECGIKVVNRITQEPCDKPYALVG